ncbi:glycosyltransferase family 2 protein [Microbacterium sp. NPDC076895]|uniref:glycosyltransferase family 2 protein n=1 Tax=Microbacterium sp. NPDC076895 TaxID=3154957 RepID=UPI003415FBD8
MSSNDSPPVVGAGSSVAAIVLCYHPDVAVVGNVQALLQQVSRVFVVNNSPDAPTAATLSPLAGDKRVTLIDQAGNVGVGAGFNVGMQTALDAGYQYVWIFDQDSTVGPGMLDALLAHADRHGARTGVVGPALRAAETGRVYDRDRGVGARDVDTLISSGSLFSAMLLHEVGLHDADLFIDYVDHDICLRAKAHGYVNVKVFDTLLDHRFGDSQPADIFGRRVYLANYSPLRHFYSARNRIILLRRFGPRGWFGEDLRYSLKAWVKLLLLENARRAKLSAAARGTWAGIRYPSSAGRRGRAGVSVPPSG